MSEKSTEKFPYKRLGMQLKRRRQKLQASLAEVSGAVEIDMDVLAAIEDGSRRPSEDILLLLISFFSIKEEEASALWKLAGYDTLDTRSEPEVPTASQQIMVLPIDARVVYTDMTHVATTPYGVTINFMQSSGLEGRPLAVSRVGMSRECALNLIELLQKALITETPKLLPAPKVDPETPTT
jgi:transcriptional regulator with XRE-family HTH domain